MAEHPAVVIAPRGSGNQTMSRHRRVAGSTPAGGTNFQSIDDYSDLAEEKIVFTTSMNFFPLLRLESF
jgi:hypothetical protein